MDDFSRGSSEAICPDDQMINGDGVSYDLRYIGAMPVRVSIKSVDLNTRTQIARTSIHRVCEDMGAKLSEDRKLDISVQKYIGPSTDKTWAMTNVSLTITSKALAVETLNGGIPMFQHNLFLVSFASGGDASTSDFICYMAKNEMEKRMCYVFECPDGMAKEVILAIGQAFRLGYQNLVKPTGNELTLTPNTCESNAFDNFLDFDDNTWLLANEFSASGVHLCGNTQNNNLPHNLNNSNDNDEDGDAHGINLKTLSQSKNNLTTSRRSVETAPDTNESKNLTNFKHLEPIGEPWYVGKMSRIQAEKLLRFDGDFLVRASVQQPGQFVLSGVQDGKYKHLLLADPNGKVRTKERVFDSIQHLVDYHVQNGAPIRSTDSEIKLVFPASVHNFSIS